MKDLEIFDENGKALHIGSVVWRLLKKLHKGILYTGVLIGFCLLDLTWETFAYYIMGAVVGYVVFFNRD